MKYYLKTIQMFQMKKKMRLMRCDQDKILLRILNALNAKEITLM